MPAPHQIAFLARGIDAVPDYARHAALCMLQDVIGTMWAPQRKVEGAPVVDVGATADPQAAEIAVRAARRTSSKDYHRSLRCVDRQRAHDCKLRATVVNSLQSRIAYEADLFTRWWGAQVRESDRLVSPTQSLVMVEPGDSRLAGSFVDRPATFQGVRNLRIGALLGHRPASFQREESY